MDQDNRRQISHTGLMSTAPLVCCYLKQLQELCAWCVTSPPIGMSLGWWLQKQNAAVSVPWGLSLGRPLSTPLVTRSMVVCKGVTEETPRQLFPPRKTSCYISASNTLSIFRGQLREARQMEEDTNRDAGVLFHHSSREALQSKRCPSRRILSFVLFCWAAWINNLCWSILKHAA